MGLLVNFMRVGYAILENLSVSVVICWMVCLVLVCSLDYLLL